MAAITAIRTHTDIHTTAVIIQTPTIIPIPTRTRRIPTAIPIRNSTGRLRNNSSTANNLMGRHRIHNRAIRLSNNKAIRPSSGTVIRHHLRRPTGLSRIPRPTMLRPLRRRPTIISLTASGTGLAIPILSSQLVEA